MRVLRYLALKGRHVSSETVKLTESVERLSNAMRCDLLRAPLKNGSQGFEEFRDKVQHELRSLSE